MSDPKPITLDKSTITLLVTLGAIVVQMTAFVAPLSDRMDRYEQQLQQTETGMDRRIEYERVLRQESEELLAQRTSSMQQQLDEHEAEMSSYLIRLSERISEAERASDGGFARIEAQLSRLSSDIEVVKSRLDQPSSRR